MPGPTHASAKALVALLKHNYEHHHAFFNSRGFHNHATHHLFAVYALGASPQLLQEVYDTHSYQQPIVESPEPITEENFSEHLGDSKYYSAYLAYFSTYLLDHTSAEALEHFVFSSEFNYVPGLQVENGVRGAKHQPEMLNRLLAGLVHPFIHVAYGIEFGVPGQVAEGLAQCSVHAAEQPAILPYSLFSSSTSPPSLSSLSLSDISVQSLTPKKPTFAFYRKISESPRLTRSALGVEPGLPGYSQILPHAGPIILDLVHAWSAGWLQDVRGEAEAEKRLEGMVEEVIWGNTVWFGISGWGARGKEAINADFFIMHLVTSALFLPTLVLQASLAAPAPALDPPLTFAHRLLLLESFLATSAVWYLTRGNPAVPIAEFFDSPSTAAFLTSPSLKPGKERKVDTSTPPDAGSEPLYSGGPAWPRVFASSLLHDNEHLCKVIRSLSFFAAKWGNRPAGYYVADGEEKGWEGIEKLDGTLFVRTAGLVMERLGWVAEGKEERNWDRDGYF
ncbi:hypothetical protein BV25DRAFT_1822291 [Artomyces pyxidatus]|uniref:Uncharacterized protein n=1 Tax=Artomyces pyxidatus TaxID=48021 RepID=A0ACB8TAY5_9AGAM|nr:hypothetical protein BV25DRAFT_1822291 [Artomyces pyxidatus]